MKIDVRSVKTYSKLIAKFVDTSHPQYSSLYLNFEEQRIYFGSNRGFGTVEMPVTDYNPKAKSFCVNALSFIAIAEAMPMLNVDGFVFKHDNGDSFQIAHMDVYDFEYPKFDIDFSDAVLLNKDYIPAIRRAGVFTAPDGAKSLDGVFVKDAHVYGMDRYRMYEEDIGADDDNLALPRNVWEILVLENLTEPKIKTDDTHIWITAGDVNLQFPVNTELKVPSVAGSSEFKAEYDHVHKIKVSKDVLGNVVQFFLPFVSDVVQQRLQFIFNAKDLEIKTEDGNIISRHVPYEEETDEEYFNGKRLWMSAIWVKNILSCLPNTKDAVVQMAVSFDVAPQDFLVVGEDKTHIVYSRLTDSV